MIMTETIYLNQKRSTSRKGKEKETKKEEAKNRVDGSKRDRSISVGSC